MAKRFKLRFSRVIPSFHSCRSQDPSTLPSNPVPSLATAPTPPLPSKTHHHSSSIKRHVLLCGCRPRPTLSDDERRESTPDLHKFEWDREDKWHVVGKVYDINPRRKIYTSSASPDSNANDSVSPPPSSAIEKEQKKKTRRVNRKKKRTTSRIRISTSSFETGLSSSEGSGGGFDDGEETKTLVSTRSSSRSLSTDSSPLTRRRKKKRSSSAARRSVSRKSAAGESEAVPARLSMFQRLIPCRVEGKVRESFAVVKKSEDPYEDFKRSMMEMVLEKQMFEERELEQLLHCFLSLNSREHHRVIVEAFTEIWEGLICCSARSSRARVSRAL
ncbi:transcription repressor OFP7 [Pyrus x bretschneideri]|uniref:transcription repressor OFP7 n=1 Tax=Pyrus x bretschneideri TaxID=225117 RepID=UPI00202FA4DA|nr:transcription repressor OFP7 [Pyrus x bretschneideri]